MSTGVEESGAARSYDLTCVDCGFTRTFEGDVFEVLEVADAHQAEYGGGATDHFVEFECAEAGEWRAERP